MNKQEARRLIKNALSSDRRNLTESEAKKLISAWGISVPKSIQIPLSTSLSKRKIWEFTSVAVKKLTPPYVLKVVSENILHKSESGGVFTDIKNIEELNNVWGRMVKNISDKMPTAKIDGFLLEEMAPKGVEIIIGGLRDPQFGPAVMFGIGGIAVELMKDVSYRLAPLDKKEVLEMFKEVKEYPLLSGFRGSKARDIDCLTNTIIKLSKILIEMKDIKEIEINPLIIYEKGVMAVDVKAVLNPE